MTAAGDWDEYDGQEPDDDWYDDDDLIGPERDPEDADIERGYEEYWEHRDDAHGGKECDCPRPEWPASDVEYSDEAPF